MPWWTSRHTTANLRVADGPPIVSADHLAKRLHDRQAHIHVAAGGVGVRTYLVSLLHQRLRIGAGNAGQVDSEFDRQAKAAGRARSDADRGGHRRVRGHLWAALRSNEFHRANEAGGITGSKQLLGIVTSAAAAAEFLRGGKFDVQRPVERRGMAIPATGGLGAGLVKHIHRHGDSSRGLVAMGLYRTQLDCAQYELDGLTFNCSQLNASARRPSMDWNCTGGRGGKW